LDLKVSCYQTDVLVVGGGGAGARAALEATDLGADVIIVSKGPIARSGVTPIAGGDIVAALGYSNPLDNSKIHAADLIKEGRGLADHNLTKVLTEEAPRCIFDLINWGVKFKEEGGNIFQFKNPGETYPRSMSIKGKGFGMMQALRKALKKAAHCRILEDFLVTRLINCDNQIVGAVGLHLCSGELTVIEAKATVLATGGNLQLWPHSDTPEECTGDGYALAADCGAELIDMEMILYYPLVLTEPESARGTIISYEHYLDPDLCGGRLINKNGEGFLPSGKPPGRDIIIQMIFAEINAGRGLNEAVLLDLSYSPDVKEKAYIINKKYLSETDRHLRRIGVDLLEKPVYVAPATHYTLGGIRIDSFGKSTVEGLFAAGEVTGNVHGANRMAGNALTETQVFGRRTGLAAAKYSARLKNIHINSPGNKEAAREKEHLAKLLRNKSSCRVTPYELKSKLKETMGSFVGFPRTQGGLIEAVSRIQDLRSHINDGLYIEEGLIYNLALTEALELEKMLTTAELVARSALLRNESRGHHFRADFPNTDKQNWCKHTRIKSTGRSGFSLDTIDIDKVFNGA
jgi:fumarate reductase (CoM/CoB) subunit A